LLSFMSTVVAIRAAFTVRVIPPLDTCSPTLRGSGVGDRATTQSVVVAIHRAVLRSRG
jgi:hypothetical protein